MRIGVLNNLRAGKNDARVTRLLRFLKSYPEVVECLLITGQSADYQLKVYVPDMEYYQEFLLNKITRIEGVTDVHSSFILREVINKTELPLNHIRSN